MLFQGKVDHVEGQRKHYKRINLERLPFGRDPTFATSSQPKRVQEVKERRDHLHLPIMH
jgi:hypothetical protein